MTPIERRAAELEVLRKRFPEIEVGPNNEWVVIRSVPLAAGWNRESVDVLFFVPPAYPSTPPDNFYVTQGLRLSNGNVPANFQDGGMNHGGAAWSMFSYHLDSGWRPVANPIDGSNLLTFMGRVESRLAEPN